MAIALYSLVVTLAAAALSVAAALPSALFVVFVLLLLVPACWHRLKGGSDPYRRT